MAAIVLNSINTTIRVTPETLLSKASDADQKIRAMEQVLNSIERTVNATKSYWTGEAADACRQQYEDQAEEISEIMKRLKAQPKTLLSIANLYKSTEQEAESTSSPLPANVID